MGVYAIAIERIAAIVILRLRGGGPGIGGQFLGECLELVDEFGGDFKSALTTRAGLRWKLLMGADFGGGDGIAGEIVAHALGGGGVEFAVGVGHEIEFAWSVSHHS